MVENDIYPRGSPNTGFKTFILRYISKKLVIGVYFRHKLRENERLMWL